MPLPMPDLKTALGTPPPAAGEGGPSSYLASKSPQLKGYLMDAVDQSLTPEERAEALCKAIENSGGDEPDKESEGAPPPADYEEDD